MIVDLFPKPVFPSTVRILETTKRISDEVDDYTLDEIDGEFFWRCCRLEPFTAFVGATNTQLTYPPQRLEELSIPAALETLKSNQHTARNFLQLSHAIEAYYPAAVFQQLLSGGRVPMRLPDIGDNWGEDDDTVSLRVYSKTVTGAEVEAAFVNRVDNVGQWMMRRELVQFGLADPGAQPKEKPDAEHYWIIDEDHCRPNHLSVRSNIEFDFVEQPDYAFDGRQVRVPYIEVKVGTPLPSAGAIAREYDRVVRNGMKWHELLPDDGFAQEKEIAIRTWTVGLLQQNDIKFFRACVLYEETTGLDSKSSPTFNNDRDRLVERVPDAAQYLYVRPQRKQRVTKPSLSHPYLEYEDIEIHRYTP